MVSRLFVVILFLLSFFSGGCVNTTGVGVVGVTAYGDAYVNYKITSNIDGVYFAQAAAADTAIPMFSVDKEGKVVTTDFVLHKGQEVLFGLVSRSSDVNTEIALKAFDIGTGEFRGIFRHHVRIPGDYQDYGYGRSRRPRRPEFRDIVITSFERVRDADLYGRSRVPGVYTK